MCAALADADSLDGCAAGLARFAGVLVDPAHILEAAIPVDPVDTGAIEADAIL